MIWLRNSNRPSHQRWGYSTTKPQRDPKLSGTEPIWVSDYLQRIPMAEGENYANPLTCLFHVLFKGAAIAFYVLFSLFVNSFVIIFVVTVFLAALDFWVVKNVSGRILVGLRWWNEISEQGDSVWKFEALDQESLSRINKKDSWLFWWTLYLTAVVWVALGIVALIKLNIDYLLVVGVCLALSIANIVGFTKCRKDAKKQVQNFASRTIASHVSSTIQSAFSVVWYLHNRSVKRVLFCKANPNVYHNDLRVCLSLQCSILDSLILKCPIVFLGNRNCGCILLHCSEKNLIVCYPSWEG